MLILNGNGADIAKHCVPGVPAKRYENFPISINCQQRQSIPLLHSYSFEWSFISAIFHCRISITFRKMDDSKLPYKFTPDPELQGIRPFVSKPLNKLPVHDKLETETITPQYVPRTTSITPFSMGKDDFPPLGGSKLVKQRPGSQRSS